MKKQQPDLSQVMSSSQAANLLKNKQAVQALLQSGEAKRLMELLNRSAGGGLKDAAQSAMKGDSTRLTQLVEGLMKDPEAAKMVEQLNKNIPK